MCVPTTYTLWFLPGVPSQMAILLEDKVVPELQRLFPPPPLRVAARMPPCKASAF